MTKKSKKKAPKPDVPIVHYSVTQQSLPFSPPTISHKTVKEMHPRQRALRGRYRIKQIHRRVKRALKGLPLEQTKNDDK